MDGLAVVGDLTQTSRVLWLNFGGISPFKELLLAHRLRVNLLSRQRSLTQLRAGRRLHTAAPGRMLTMSDAGLWPLDLRAPEQRLVGSARYKGAQSPVSALSVSFPGCISRCITGRVQGDGRGR